MTWEIKGVKPASLTNFISYGEVFIASVVNVKALDTSNLYPVFERPELSEVYWEARRV
jgi:hypothetical protein